MAADDRNADTLRLSETPEEAARAIGSALDFLRVEAAAIGMRDVAALIALARARMREYRFATTGPAGRH